MIDACVKGKELLELWVKINSSVIAKDKFYRLVQYASKMIAFHLSSCQQSSSVSFGGTKQAILIVRLRKLSAAISMCRKFYRIGKWIEQLKAAKISLEMKNELERVLCVSKSLGLACWLFLDSLQWLHRSGIVLFPRTWEKSIDRNASLFWIVSIVSSIVLNGSRLSKEFKLCNGNLTEKNVVKYASELIISLCDLALPLGLLGIVKDEGFVGLCGMISSYLALKGML